MSQPVPYTPILNTTKVQRMDFEVMIELDAAGGVERILFDGFDHGRRFLCPQNVTLLVLHLRTKDSNQNLLDFRDESATACCARFATHPIQFKNADGRPIPQPPFIHVRRDDDTRCTVTVTNTVVSEESFGFHGVFLHGSQLFGSPDPTIDLEPPPCTPPC